MNATATTDTFDIVVSPHSGIADDPSGLDLRIYPNPNTGQFMVSMNLSEIQDIELRVLSLTGQLLWTEKYADQVGDVRYNIDLATKAKGYYNLEIVTKKQKITKRFVVY
jgi:hypothetical protein